MTHDEMTHDELTDGRTARGTEDARIALSGVKGGDPKEDQSC
jgi:hypothetical protein